MTDFVGTDNDGSLVTAIKKYSNGEKEISLVGCCHIGEKEYFADMKDYLDSLDAVLWEGAGKSVPKTFQGQMYAELGKALGQSYKKMADAYGVSVQNDIIDYKNLNGKWIHADMDTDEIATELFNSPADLIQLGMAAFLGGISVPPKEMFKQMMPQAAKQKNDQLSEMLNKIFPSNGEKKMDVILGKRNIIVKEKLDDALGAGYSSIGIFYGAAHMDEIEEYVTGKGFELTEEKWLKAIK